MKKILGKRSVNFDKILDIVGTNGRYQKMMVFLTSLAFIPNALAAMGAVFLAASPRYWCYMPQTENFTLQEQHLMSWSSGGSVSSDNCYIYGGNYSLLPNQVNGNGSYDYVVEQEGVQTTECKIFQYDDSQYKSTIVTEWNLVCSKVWLKALSTSLFMLGQLFGVFIFGHLADIIGRTKAWLVSVVVTAASGSAAAFVPSYWAYCTLRLLSGASSLGGCVCTFTLGMETVGVSERKLAFVLPHIGYRFGILLTALFGYFIRDYSWLQLTIALSAVPLLATHWILGESPRWLLKTGQYNQAEKEIQRMARMNNITLPQNFLDTLDLSLLNVTEDVEEKKYNVLDLMRTPNMRLKTLITWLIWFVTSMIYFGLSLGIGDLAGNTYINLCIAGCIEILGCMGLYLFMDRVGRVPLLSLCLFLAGIFCALTVALSGVPWLAVSFSLMGRMLAMVSFCTLYLQATEFYPTLVRGIGLGAASMSARVGSLLSPFIADMDSLVWSPLPQILFASFSLVAGFLCFFMPETLHQKLPDTLEEGEKFARGKRGCCPYQQHPSPSEQHSNLTQAV